MLLLLAQNDDITSEISDSSKITKIEFDGNHLINESDIVKPNIYEYQDYKIDVQFKEFE